ncbi:MAG TPA: hypothetical protein VIV60_14785 [Polyangiaceae bacterium]
MLRNSRELFTSTNRDAAFVAALARSVSDDWPTPQPLLQDVLEAVPAGRLPQSMQALIAAICWAVRVDLATPPPKGLAEWLMSQLFALPNIEAIGGNMEWHVKEILKRIGRPDLKWLCEALQHRQEQMSAPGEGTKPRAVSYNARVGKYVRPDRRSSCVRCRRRRKLVIGLRAGQRGVGYYLPEILCDVDPEGLVVPFAVAARAVSALACRDTSLRNGR